MPQADVMRFEVIAQNEATNERAATEMLSSVVNVTVRVLDANDNPPIIVGPSSTAANSSDDDIDVEFDVCGHARSGDRILGVVASDADTGLNARLQYTLLDDATSSSSSSYFSINGDDGWIVARQDLGQLAVGQKFPVTVLVTDGGRPPLSANKTFLLTTSEKGCIAAVAAAGSGQLRASGKFTAAVISTVVILFLVVVLIVVLMLMKCSRLGRHREKLDGGSVVMERRWTEADGAEELTAKQRLNSGVSSEKTSTLCFRHPSADDDIGISYNSNSGGGARSCFNIQHEFEVVWQASSPCYLRQVYILKLFRQLSATDRQTSVAAIKITQGTNLRFLSGAISISKNQ